MADSPQKSNFVQPLSPTSFVTQRTEVTVASSEDVKDNEKYLTVVHISADGKGSSVTHDLLPRRWVFSDIYNLLNISDYADLHRHPYLRFIRRTFIIQKKPAILPSSEMSTFSLSTRSLSVM